MLSIAKTHPGFEKWTDYDKQWSRNGIYNPVTKQKDVVTASPAETLNLFCATLFDKKHMVTTPGSDWDKDLSDRIHSLFIHLRNLFNAEQQGQHEICAAGRQHGILFLLNHVFCEKPGQPYVLIEDQNTFALDQLSEFMKAQLESSQQSQEVMSDWVLYQAGMIQREIAPVITFLRKQFPSELTDNLDIKWQEAFKTYLESQFEKFGLDPATAKAEDLAKNIEYIQLPTANPLLQELLKTENVAMVASLQSLTKQRNLALDDFKSRFKKDNQSVSSDEIQSLFIAESLFQKIFQNRYHALLIGNDDPAFHAALQPIQQALIHIFLTKSLPADFESIKTNYLKALNDLHKSSQYDSIENFFINGGAIDQNLAKLHASISSSGSNPFLISDKALEKWYQENTSSEDCGAIDVSPYEINRILLHALLIKDQSDQYSDQFSRALEFICNWLLEPEKTTDSVGKVTLKKNYPPFFIHALLIPVIIKREPETLKEKLIAILKTKDDFINLLQNLKPDHCKIVCTAIKDELFKSIWVTNNMSDLMGSLAPRLTSEQSKAVFESLKDPLLKMVKDMGDLYFFLNHCFEQDSEQYNETMIERLLQGDIPLIENDLYDFRKKFTADQYTKIVCGLSTDKMFKIFSKFSTHCSPEIHFNHMIAGLANNEIVLKWLCGLYQHIEGLKCDNSFQKDMKSERLKYIKNNILDNLRDNPVGSATQLKDEVAKKAIEVLEKDRTFSIFSTTSSKDPVVVGYREYFAAQAKSTKKPLM